MNLPTFPPAGLRPAPVARMLCIAVTVLIGLLQWAIYTALLWMMIKFQSLNYTWLGLLGSTLLATLLGYIPLVGPYVGWVALVLCLWKLTKADIAPDILFTVGVAGALMFVVNLFAIGWLLTNLHVASPFFAAMDDGSDDDEEELAGMGDQKEDDDTVAEGSVSIRIIGAPWVKPDFEETIATAPAPVATNIPTRPTDTAPLTTVPAVYADASTLPAKLILKGVSMNGALKTAMISDGKQILTVREGEPFSVAGTTARMTLTCEEITRSAVILAPEQGGKVRLGFY